jgi:hypothetical protein
MSELPKFGFLGLGGPEIVVLLGLFAVLLAVAILVIVRLGARSGKSHQVCPHCGKKLDG